MEIFYVLMALVSLLTGYIATSISIWMIRNKTYKDRKSGETTHLFLKNHTEEIDTNNKVWGKVSFGYYWRSILLIIVLSLLGFFVFGTVGDQTTIISFMGLYLGWMWFFLLNDKKSIYIDFTVATDVVE
jgi:nitrogen fixation-related uncharacterized protein